MRHVVNDDLTLVASTLKSLKRTGELEGINSEFNLYEYKILNFRNYPEVSSQIPSYP